MPIVFDPRQLAHAPARELHNGDWTTYQESPARVRSILAAIGDVAPATDHGMAPLLAVHDAAYLDFLRAAHADWGAQTALTALDQVADGTATRAFALCRPPGHHAGRDYYGGYCYLNNAAIVAAEARARGLGPVAILDIDYHHGNGTQDIFYADGEMLFVSIHADPATDYPFYWGHADETGEGAGRGTTLNLPLPHATDWAAYARALDRALAAIADAGTRLLVLSFGADTYVDDPISHFALQRPDFATMAARIAATGLPIVTVMEGGYATDALGDNVATFIEGLG